MKRIPQPSPAENKVLQTLSDLQSGYQREVSNLVKRHHQDDFDPDEPTWQRSMDTLRQARYRMALTEFLYLVLENSIHASRKQKDVTPLDHLADVVTVMAQAQSEEGSRDLARIPELGLSTQDHHLLRASLAKAELPSDLTYPGHLLRGEKKAWRRAALSATAGIVATTLFSNVPKLDTKQRDTTDQERREAAHEVSNAYWTLNHKGDLMPENASRAAENVKRAQDILERPEEERLRAQTINIAVAMSTLISALSFGIATLSAAREATDYGREGREQLAGLEAQLQDSGSAGLDVHHQLKTMIELSSQQLAANDRSLAGLLGAVKHTIRGL